MRPEITIEKVWFDDDLTELKISVCNGKSLFTNKVYVGSHQISELVDALNIFKNHYYGGLKDILLGTFESHRVLWRPFRLSQAATA